MSLNRISGVMLPNPGRVPACLRACVWHQLVQAYMPLHAVICRYMPLSATRQPHACHALPRACTHWQRGDGARGSHDREREIMWLLETKGSSCRKSQPNPRYARHDSVLDPCALVQANWSCDAWASRARSRCASAARTVSRSSTPTQTPMSSTCMDTRWPPLRRRPGQLSRAQGRGRRRGETPWWCPGETVPDAPFAL